MTETGGSLEEWLENPYWASYYHGAPSDRCREFIALEFRYSDSPEEETGREMDRIEETLGAEDLLHLLKYCGNNPRRGILTRKIEEKCRLQGDR